MVKKQFPKINEWILLFLAFSTLEQLLFVIKIAFMTIEDPLRPRHQVEALFHQALELDSSERMAFLSQSCNGDTQLQDEVLSLIKAFEKENDFLEKPLQSDVLSGPENLVEGQKLGRYQINHVVGHGGMGDVYLADDTILGRKVALKLLPASFSSSESRLARFRMEAKTASSLNHPGIMTVYEIGHEQANHYIAAEYVEGSTVRGLLSHGPVPVEKALDIAFQVARALAVAHAAGIIHRDIKPENIMVRPDGYVKVLDFGLAKPAENFHLEMTCVATMPGVLLGTVDYMSPEQARGLALDARTDLFSLGAVLYEMLTGKAAFKEKTPTDTLASILDREPPSFTETNPFLSQETEVLVKRLLAKERGQRLQSAEELAGELERTRKQLTHGISARSPKRAQPKMGLWISISLAAVILAAAGLWLLHERRNTPAPASTGVTLTARVGVSGNDGQETDNANFDSSGNLKLAGNRRFRLHLTATHPGHFYLINESQPGNGQLSEFVTLFPSPTANAGSSFLSADREVVVPQASWFVVDTSPGIDTLWMVWSRSIVPKLETIEKYSTLGQKGLVPVSEDREMLVDFFRTAQKNQSAKAAANREIIELSEQDQVLAWSIKILK